MSSYTAAQYAEQRRITQAGNRANATGLCVVCERRPLGVWPDGVRRITCGADECYRRWFRFRPEKESES